jgi:hypothetical protein
MHGVGTGWTAAAAPDIRVVLDEDVRDLRAAIARINASEPRVRASSDGTTIRIDGAESLNWSGIPVYYGPRPRFEGRLALDTNGERTVDGSIIRSDSANAFAVLGLLIAGFAFLAGVLVVSDGDRAGFLSVVASFVIAGAVLAGWRLHDRLADGDGRTIVNSLAALGPVTHR